MKGKKGRVGYGARAFQQDALESMSGDIIRALIETITNSDDAYRDKPGRILIEVLRGKNCFRVITRDMACGMRAVDLDQRIAKLGERTSGFELGQNVRGNLGRGAKDLAAFGDVDFESIYEGQYSRLRLETSGDYKIFGEKPATAATRRRLKIIEGNGTTVTMHVDRDRFPCPRIAKLAEKLVSHFQLRDVLSAPGREVYISETSAGPGQLLTHTAPQRSLIKDVTLDIPSYPEANARLILYRNSVRYENSPNDPCRPEGILVKGTKAIYENTLFKFNSNPFSGWFSGVLLCPFIDQLAREYDRHLEKKEPQEARNSMPIISRRRDGLQKFHPFYKTLKIAVERILAPLIEAEEAKVRGSRMKESQEMQKDIRNLEKDLTRIFNDDLRELEDDEEGGSQRGESIPALRVVPSSTKLTVGGIKSFTVYARRELGIESVSLAAEREDVIRLPEKRTLTLTPHKRRKDISTVTFEVQGIDLVQKVRLTVSAVSYVAVTQVSVCEATSDAKSPVVDLSFECKRYRLRPAKIKYLRLRAPIDLIEAEGDLVRVSASGNSIKTSNSEVVLELDSVSNCYCALIRVMGNAVGDSATITAQLGERLASCSVEITALGGGPVFSLQIVDEASGHSRAIVMRSDDKIVIQVQGRHPDARRYLGLGPEFIGQNLADARGYLAELVAYETARILVEKKFATAGSLPLDVGGFYFEHSHVLGKYLSACHKALAPRTMCEGIEIEMYPAPKVSHIEEHHV